MTNTEKLKSLGMLGDVRQRLGSNGANDSSLDEEINILSNTELVANFTAWHLGSEN